MLYTFRVDKPEAAGTFVMSPLQLSPVHAEGMNFSVYTPPAAASTAQSYADAVARILDFYNGEFGALPEPGMKIAQILDGTVDGYAAPGLLLVSARQWSAQPNARLLANLAAQQWWGDQVMAASPSDVWITDGLARYSEALYVEQTSGKEGMNKALEDFAVGALMFEDAAPIAEARRLEPESEEYRSVVVNKGAMVFHMLRALMGDANFAALLKDFYSRYAGKTARIQDFEQMAEARVCAAARLPEVKAIGNAPAAAAGTCQPAAIFRAVAAFHGRSGIHGGIRHLPHQEGIPDRRQGQAGSRFLPHGRRDGGSNRRQSGIQDDQDHRKGILVSRWRRSGGQSRTASF